MGFGDFLKKGVGFLGRGLTSVIPGTLDDRLFEAGFNALTGGGSRAPEGAIPGRCPAGFTSGPRGECVPQATFAPTMMNTAPATRTAIQDQVPVPGVMGAVQRFLPGGKTGFQDAFGEAVMGRYGAGLEPAGVQSVVFRCPKGMVLGDDNICYDKPLANAKRKWPRGRRPLLTGGEMRAISTAASAAGKLEKKQKQLQRLGMLKKPSRPRPKALPRTCN